MYVIFDIEGTGLSSSDEVLQLAMMYCDKDFVPKFAINRYCMSDIQIHPQAQGVHGLTREIVKQRSGGKFFEEVLDELRRDYPILFKDCTYIAYNIKFDRDQINNTLEHQGLDAMDFGGEVRMLDRTGKPGLYSYCAMNGLISAINGNKSAKLIELFQRHITPDGNEAKADFKKLANAMKDDVYAEGAHDAVYDVWMTWRLLRKFRGMLYA